MVRLRHIVSSVLYITITYVKMKLDTNKQIDETHKYLLNVSVLISFLLYRKDVRSCNILFTKIYGHHINRPPIAYFIPSGISAE